MNKNFRGTLFFICFTLFLIIAPIIILSSQGYRIDLNLSEGKIKITQTGGLFLKVLPRQAEIFLDSKLKETTDFFFNSVLIENLIPKKYKVLVKKQGYHSWQKELEIKEKEVTAIDNIFLFPQNPEFKPLTEEEISQFLTLFNNNQEVALDELLLDENTYQLLEQMNGFKLSPDSKKLVYFSDHEIWILFLKEKQNQPLKKAGEKLFLMRLSEKIKDVLWINSYYLVFSAENKIKISEIDERDKINMIDLVEYENPEIFFNKKDKKLYVLSNEIWYQSQALLP